MASTCLNEQGLASGSHRAHCRTADALGVLERGLVGTHRTSGRHPSNWAAASDRARCANEARYIVPALFLPLLWLSRNLCSGSFSSWYSRRGVPLNLHVLLKKARWTAISVTVIFTAVRAPPGRRGVSRYLAKVLAQVWLVGESALQRYVAQGRFRLKHVLSRQLDASPDQEGMRRLAEGAPKGAREMRFAELHKRAKIRDKYWTCDMTINMRTHLPRLPGAQSPPSVWRRLSYFGINLLPQQRGCLNYRAVNRLLVI